MQTKRLATVLALTCAALLTGCASKPQTLYQWDGYQPQVYQFFKGESPEQQIIEMEKAQQLISAKGASTPPGFHAHLGMLYSITGKTNDQVAAQFEDEKRLFPESTTYMDFLMAKMKKGENL